MDPLSAILAFSLAAGLLTLTPGLDTALVLRTNLHLRGTHRMPALCRADLAEMQMRREPRGHIALGDIASFGIVRQAVSDEIRGSLVRKSAAPFMLWGFPGTSLFQAAAGVRR